MDSSILTLGTSVIRWAWKPSPSGGEAGGQSVTSASISTSIRRLRGKLAIPATARQVRSRDSTFGEEAHLPACLSGPAISAGRAPTRARAIG